MTITYTYEIINVDEKNRCMEVVYSTEGKPAVHVGTRLPFEGESHEYVIDLYSPVALWREQDLAVVVPEVGKIGSITVDSPVGVLSISEQNKLKAQQLLRKTDWTQLADVPLLNKEDYAAYRQQIRDIVLNPASATIQWPVEPMSMWS